MKFLPEDFAVAWCTTETSHKEMDVVLAKAVCDVANAKLESLGIPEKLKRLKELEKMIKEAPVVYFSSGPDSWIDEKIYGTTHTAKLVCVEEISDDSN